MNKSKVKHKVISLVLLSICILTVCFGTCYIKQANKEKSFKDEDGYGVAIVKLNEVDAILKSGDIALSQEKIADLSQELRELNKADYKSNKKTIIMFYLVSVLSVTIIYIIIYFIILRPFDKLEGYAEKIAEGDLDADLKYERVNMFGEFTWAFDHMRKEIKRAKQCEQAAIENNKTVIASLSHDIKTPVASIRAYAEGLQENMDTTPERRNKYINVIIKKCDEVTKITNDMFIHSLHDLDKLVLKKENVEIDSIIKDTVLSMSGDGYKISIVGDIIPATIKDVDGGRIAQVLENIIGNAKKYAPKSKIDIWTKNISDDTGKNNCYEIHIRDFGQGIPSEDMPFIFDKFYRGRNRGDKDGAGLGLFIVKYMMEQMKGAVHLENSKDGLEVILTFSMI